ncbi:hypothetical protein D3C78_1128860 [compost metagenome]
MATSMRAGSSQWASRDARVSSAATVASTGACGAADSADSARSTGATGSAVSLASAGGASLWASSCAHSASSASMPPCHSPRPLWISAASTCCSASSTAACGVLRKPAANWCSRRRMSSEAAWNTASCCASPQPSGRTCISACSSARASRDRSLKPTVAELPASECAQATASSGCGRCGSCAHSCKTTPRLRDHSSASLR